MSSNFYVFRSLIVASSLWLTIMIVFYYSFSPEYVEHNRFRIEDAKSLKSDNKVGENLDQTKAKDLKEIFTKKPNRKKPNEDQFKYKKLVTPVSPEILRQLHLINPGEMGREVKLKNFSEDIKQRIQQGWKRHEFNEFLSDMIALNRSLPDPRDEYCRQPNLYLPNLPATSVIIIFHNEAWSTLLRSVHSVLNRSPDHLITEVILVDDFSNMPHLKKPLDDYMSQFPKVKVLRAKDREGLIKARIRGATAARGPVLTFLDSHIECTEGWLEPLLDRIARDPTYVPCPVIDVVDDDTFGFSYQPSSILQVGGFDWNLVFDWIAIPDSEKQRKNNSAEPTRSPTMAGGLFSIDKDFFVKLGMYDPDFDIWGAENLELSFKTWMCGGTLEIIPCSHVGHIFRKKSPYKWRPGVDVLRKNTVRLVEVWLDEYARIYYSRTSFKKGDFGDISARVQLRKDLRCKSFKWYLDNIFYYQKIPDNLADGEVYNGGLSDTECLDSTVMDNDDTGVVSMYPCHKDGGNQYFEYSKDFEIKKGTHCLDFNDNVLQMYNCHGEKGTQMWKYNLETQQFVHNVSSQCLTMGVATKKISMQPCNGSDHYQKWIFKYLYKEKFLGFNKTEII